jgi:hypothetical protein
MTIQADLIALQNDSRTLSDKFHAGGFAPAPDHMAGVPGPGIARKGELEPSGQRNRLLERNPRAGPGDVGDHASPHGESAVERDPGRFAQQLAGFPLLGKCHPRSPEVTSLAPRALKNR